MKALRDIQAEQAQFSIDYFPNQNNLMHHTVALAGEVGEFANWVKKVDRESVPFDQNTRFEMAKELADVLIYVVDCATMLGLDLDMAYEAVFAHNKERFTLASSSDQSHLLTAVQQRQQDPDGAGAFVSEHDIL